MKILLPVSALCLISMSPVLPAQTHLEGVEVRVEALGENYRAMCSIVEIETPAFKRDGKLLSNVISTVSIYSTAQDKLVAVSKLSVELWEQRYLSVGCLPLNQDYRVEIDIAYHPEGQLELCPKRLQISDLSSFINAKDEKAM
ncbi:hypothetical protein [Pseudidiomarina terrestris]|uniref:Uncharacterized protein n=1 Tax=Pseudidiomarina terrestris TaxID=2820060 RepID=A0AAW7R324_9GAMM|nr:MULTISPECIES: hypothetical protein [unclassified Pseudidiomarina]MDN7125610.1 hypothetical protein [Pseudidiomarina sp. 1APP75-32.1]MDN7126140.1 hypothetical protein [Pseudidiomarina sp. 1APR75-33.1]MDN7130526.1 hypothetical protein [Pseudidiomarina sp. 1APR75-15]MDN7134168.1 hypothetical protein [Pseudidiomarina sp. 1ASP75-5]MDN7137145.1 hypothetical protein [Pseudidiomarina sp. 1ASP75-14]